MAKKGDKFVVSRKKNTVKTPTVQSIFARANAHLTHIKKYVIPHGEIENFRLKYGSSKGIVKELFAYMSYLPNNEKKKAYGDLLNKIMYTVRDKVETYLHTKTGSSIEYASNVTIVLGGKKGTGKTASLPVS